MVGAESARGLELMREVYQPLIEQGTLLIETDLATAKLAKHACNAFLALKISFPNAMARICERAGADVAAVADIMGSDPRIGRAFLDAGLGFGGSCFPKDIAAFQRLVGRLGWDFPLLGEIARINDEAGSGLRHRSVVPACVTSTGAAGRRLGGLSLRGRPSLGRRAPLRRCSRLGWLACPGGRRARVRGPSTS